MNSSQTRAANADNRAYFILAFSLFVLGLFVYILVTIKSLMPIKEIERRAFDESDFQQTEYWIYDRGGDGDCDRLIIVKPFEWHLLNVNRQLFLIDAERPINCGPNKVSALRILKDTLIECCVDVSFDSMMQLYDRADTISYVRVPFTIKGDRYTIYTAINELAEKYLDFEPNAKSAPSLGNIENVYSVHNRGYNFTGILSKRFVRSLLERSSDYNDGDEIGDRNRRDFGGKITSRTSYTIRNEADIRAKLYAELTAEELAFRDALDEQDRAAGPNPAGVIFTNSRFFKTKIATTSTTSTADTNAVNVTAEPSNAIVDE